MAKTAYETKKEANKRYLEKLDEMRVRAPKGTKADVQAHAARMGESANAFILRAIRETMERDDAERSL